MNSIQTKTTKGWVLYARKSTESEDRQIQSIEDQIKYLEELAHRERLPIIEIISEAKSAKEPDKRGGFKRLLSLIETGNVQGVLTWKLDRLSRNPIDSSRMQWYLQTNKIKCIKTSDRNYLPEDNALLFAVEQGMANQYVRDLSKNVKRGMHSKAEKGWYPCIPPIGYLNSKLGDKGNEQIIIDSDRFHLVRKMWDLMLSGSYTPPDILRVATREWKLLMPTRRKHGGKPMVDSYIYKLFANIFYTGNFYLAGKLYKGNHTTMVTMDEFDRVQYLLGKKSSPRAIVHEFPFTGLMTCATCGAAITATEKKKLIKTKGEYATYTYYHCTKRKRFVTCTERPIEVSELEAQIETLLEKNTIHEKFFEIGLEVLKENAAKDDDKEAALRESQAQNMQFIQSKIDRLFTYLMNGTISEDEYTDQKLELQSTLAKEKARFNQIEQKVTSANRRLENVLHFAVAAVEAFKRPDMQVRKEIVLSLGSNQRINAKKFLIDLHSWFNTLKKGEENLMSEIERLELRKPNTDKAQNDYFKISRLMWGLLEDVRTEIIDSPVEPNIPDLSSWVKKK